MQPIKMAGTTAVWRRNWFLNSVACKQCAPGTSFHDSVSAARSWNSLSTAVQSSESLDVFRRRLKTELFARSFPDPWQTCQMIDFCVTQFSQPRAVATLKFFYYNVALTCMINNSNNNNNNNNVFVCCLPWRHVLLKTVKSLIFNVKSIMAKACKTLSSEQKCVVIEMYKQGITQNEIARLFSVNKSTVCRIVSRFTSIGNIENLRRSGRPKLLSPKRPAVIDLGCQVDQIDPPDRSFGKIQRVQEYSRLQTYHPTCP